MTYTFENIQAKIICIPTINSINGIVITSSRSRTGLRATQFRLDIHPYIN